MGTIKNPDSTKELYLVTDSSNSNIRLKPCKKLKEVAKEKKYIERKENEIRDIVEKKDLCNRLVEGYHETMQSY
jgi:hypothetical protein